MSDTLRLEHDIEAARHARHWIEQRCHEWQCPDDLAEAAALLVTELVTNVFLHAHTDCLIHAEFEDSILTVTVTDNDPHQLSIQPTSTNTEHGRGLAIVEAIADAWGIQHADGSKSVWFHLNDHPPPSPHEPEPRPSA